MRTLLLSLVHRRGLLLAALALLAPGLLAGGGPLLYRAVRGSTFERRAERDPAGGFGPVPVQGTFQMTPQLSPLDWDVFHLTDLRLEAFTGEAQPLVLRGAGTFRRSERFQRMRMELDVSFGTTAVHLESGDVPAEPWGPEIDMVLKGAASGATKGPTYVLHLAAVPVLASWRYRLFEGSTLTDDCGPCGRPTISLPMRGVFDLVLIEENPLFSRYHLFDVRFYGGLDYEFRGEGEYQVGGEVAVRQELRLELDVKGAAGGPRVAQLASPAGPPMRRWPMWAVDAKETGGPLISTLSLEVRAAPVRELWFSTAHGMTPGNQPGLEPRISGGDVLADNGRRVKSNAELVRALGWEEVKEPLLADAVTVAPKGEIWFSFSEGQISPTLGAIGDGDLVSDRGRVVMRNGDMMAAFGLMPPAADHGLDGVQVLEDGELLFSITRPAFSERLGVTLSPGDILSNRGAVRHGYRDLLRAFSPKDPEMDPGVDAFVEWSSGEVWFSTESGFESKAVGWVMDGDLLSDQGYLVARNLELVGAFQPLEDLANFGLDGLFVVSDAMAGTAPVAVALDWDGAAGGAVRLSWRGTARVFQVEKTGRLGNPFGVLSPVVPELEWMDRAVGPASATGFYRVRQW